MGLWILFFSTTIRNRTTVTIKKQQGRESEFDAFPFPSFSVCWFPDVTSALTPTTQAMHRTDKKDDIDNACDNYYNDNCFIKKRKQHTVDIL